MKKLFSIVILLVYFNIPLHSLWHEFGHDCGHGAMHAETCTDEISKKDKNLIELTDCSICLLNSDNSQALTTSYEPPKKSLLKSSYGLPQFSITLYTIDKSNLSRGPPTC